MSVVEQLEPPVPTDQRLCGCGRSSTGFCIGLHSIPDEEWDRKMRDEAEYQLDGRTNELDQS